MKFNLARTFRELLSFALLVVLLAGCGAYFNTFYNARKAFNEAEKTRKQQEARTRRVNRGGNSKYQLAIEKALKVVENHPNSGYYDDALYVLGVSYYHTGQYARSERRFREILANFPESKFVRDATLYLAKAKLELDETDDARDVFEDIFNSDYNKEFKTEAAMALGDYHYKKLEYDEALKYYIAIRDSLGNGEQKLRAQVYIADTEYDRFRFGQALSAYLQVLGLNPEKDDRYHAMFRAAICSFRLQRIAEGLDYLNTLSSDELYFDSVGAIRMAMAEGYEADDDLIQAENLYRQVVDNDTDRGRKALANYYLGLMYQFDYDDLVEAKKYYDAVVSLSRGTDFAADALQRSSDIGKLSTYSKKIEMDSTATLDMIDEAAETQYNLSELYWLKLNKPDTAMIEMQYLIDSFPEAYVVPKAMVALAQMYREQEADSATADSILHDALNKYAHTDFAPDILEALDLAGTAADTGYALYYIRQAEDAFVDSNDIDLAREKYQYVVDNFPESEYYLQARFNIVWLEENYENPGDSSVYYAYQELADSFPGTDWGQAAERQLSYAPRPKMEEPEKEEGGGDEQRGLAGSRSDELPGRLGADTAFAEGQTAEVDETESYLSAQQRAYIRPNGDTIVLLDLEPTMTEEPFEFPTQTFGIGDQDFYLYFQILLDFSGEVTDLVLKNPSQNDELNDRVTRAVASMKFDPLEVSNRVVSYNLAADESGGHWFVYRFFIKLPDYLK